MIPLKDALTKNFNDFTDEWDQFEDKYRFYILKSLSKYYNLYNITLIMCILIHINVMLCHFNVIYVILSRLLSFLAIYLLWFCRRSHLEDVRLW